jgi:hypothetical protein
VEQDEEAEAAKKQLDETTMESTAAVEESRVVAVAESERRLKHDNLRMLWEAKRWGCAGSARHGIAMSSTACYTVHPRLSISNSSSDMSRVIPALLTMSSTV